MGDILIVLSILANIVVLYHLYKRGRIMRKLIKYFEENKIKLDPDKPDDKIED